ncbi:unnamed protein product, partial [Rotaria magnacalcarata]
LAAHEGLQYVDLVLKMIDDLFVLLGGLVPNVQTMIIKLQQSRLLKIPLYDDASNQRSNIGRVFYTMANECRFL